MSQKELNLEELEKVSGGKVEIEDRALIECPHCHSTFNVSDVENNNWYCPNPNCRQYMGPSSAAVNKDIKTVTEL